MFFLKKPSLVYIVAQNTIIITLAVLVVCAGLGAWVIIYIKRYSFIDIHNIKGVTHDKMSISDCALLDYQKPEKSAA